MNDFEFELMDLLDEYAASIFIEDGKMVVCYTTSEEEMIDIEGVDYIDYAGICKG
tara:strand:+ start:820 stop:984 length:165 start_codon:yes stop_codon:yes gene_type:complete